MDNVRNKAHLILIGGGTCSGKTTIANEIGERLRERNTVIISHDNYYRDLGHLTEEEIAQVNFDHPDSIDHEYLIADVRRMMAGQTVTIPQYSFITHRRTEGSESVSGAEVIILEGIFALYYARLLNLADLKIFVDTDADIRLLRRVQRDTQDRGFKLPEVLAQYMETVKPMHEAFIDKTKKNADFIVPGEKEFDKVLGMLNSYLMYEMVRK